MPITYVALLVEILNDIFTCDCSITYDDETYRRNAGQIGLFLADDPDASRELALEVSKKGFDKSLFVLGNQGEGLFKIVGR